MSRALVTTLGDAQDIWEQLQSIDPNVLALTHMKSIGDPIRSITVGLLPVYLYSPVLHACVFILQHQTRILRARMFRTLCLVEGRARKDRTKISAEGQSASPGSKKAILKTSMTKMLELAVSQGNLVGSQRSIPDRAGAGLDGLDAEAVIRSRSSSSNRSLFETQLEAQLGSQMRSGDPANAHILAQLQGETAQHLPELDDDMLYNDNDFKQLEQSSAQKANSLLCESIADAIVGDMYNSGLLDFPVRKKRAPRARSFNHLADDGDRLTLKYTATLLLNTRISDRPCSTFSEDMLLSMPLFVGQPLWLARERPGDGSTASLLFTYYGYCPAFFEALGSRTKTHTLTASQDLEQRATSASIVPIQVNQGASNVSRSSFSEGLQGRQGELMDSNAFDLSNYDEADASTAQNHTNIILQRLEGSYPRPVSFNSILNEYSNPRQRRQQAALMFLAILNLRANGTMLLQQAQHDILCILTPRVQKAGHRTMESS